MAGSVTSSIFVSDLHAEQAQELTARFDSPEASLFIQNQSTLIESEHRIPPELASIFRQIVHIIGEGGSVNIAALPNELTTTSAAAIIGISRPTLMKLIRAGKIPAHKVGSHTRLKCTDVKAFTKNGANTEHARQLAVFDELRAAEDALEGSPQASPES